MCHAGNVPQQFFRRYGTTHCVLRGVAHRAPLFLCPPAAAHAPSDMSLAYRETAGELVVTLTHQVADPATHYVNEVKVSVDGRIVNATLYTSQPSATTFSYSYPVQAPAGSSIGVYAACVLGGSITRTVRVPGPAGSDPAIPGQPEPTTKAAAGIALVLGPALPLLWGGRTGTWIKFILSRRKQVSGT